MFLTLNLVNSNKKFIKLSHSAINTNSCIGKLIKCRSLNLS
jgi:hypothetical protein